MTVPSPSPGGPATTAPGEPRRLGRRRALPTGRAVTGALLITLAFAGALALGRSGDHGPATSYVVASRAVSPGEVIDASAVRTIPIDLPLAQAEHAFTSIQELDGAVSLAPVAPGEVIQRGGVRLPAQGEPAGVPQVTVSLERARALGGRLQVGEPVDVLATLGSGEQASTSVLARRATAVAVDVPKSGVGSSGAVLVTLALPDAARALAVAHAGEVGAVTLVRPGVGDDGPDRYPSEASSVARTRGSTP